MMAAFLVIFRSQVSQKEKKESKRMMIIQLPVQSASCKMMVIVTVEKWMVGCDDGFDVYVNVNGDNHEAVVMILVVLLIVKLHDGDFEVVITVGIDHDGD